ncbi:MAG: zeta toxin family protein [Acidimicrobiia bacterium]|nr:zeta toxin family protein [Acidimicrobiia bacterium]
MKGDIIIVEDHHREAGRAIAARLSDEIRGRDRRSTITVAGESGSGKSETATAIAEELGALGIDAVVLQQDDYFVHPPKTNDRTRREDIGWVGPQEVRLDLLDEHLEAARSGADTITKPLVIYEEDRTVEETVDLSDADVVVAEGTYTSLLEHVDARVFIARNRLETMEHRRKRGREEYDPFIEEVLEIEHEIISQHLERADVVISRDYDVAFVGG